MGTRTLIVTGASAQSARDIRGPSPLVTLENEPPPVFGKGALDVSPRLGHVHIAVDDAAWHFVQASGQTVFFGRLAFWFAAKVSDRANPTD